MNDWEVGFGIPTLHIDGFEYHPTTRGIVFHHEFNPPYSYAQPLSRIEFWLDLDEAAVLSRKIRLNPRVVDAVVMRYASELRGPSRVMYTGELLDYVETSGRSTKYTLRVVSGPMSFGDAPVLRNTEPLPDPYLEMFL